MPWLARLDARAKLAPRAVFATYSVIKWTLVALGVYGVVGLAVIEIREKRVGLGTGVLITLLFAGIKGIMLARQRHH